jgi:cytidylate kinase
MPEPYSDDFPLPVLEPGVSPLHGYRGSTSADETPSGPAGLTIAISREAGSRGGTIAKRAGEKLGWEVFSQEMLDYGVQNAPFREDLLERLSPNAKHWIEQHLRRLMDERDLTNHPNMRELAHLVLTLAALGNVILLGRGAGFLLPSRSTLHVRFVAPLADRVAYMSQWLRLTEEEAAEQVRKRDHRRTEYLATHFHRKPNDDHLYDMVLNTSLLGEDRCADVIAAAAKAKMSAFVGLD